MSTQSIPPDGLADGRPGAHAGRSAIPRACFTARMEACPGGLAGTAQPDLVGWPQVSIGMLATATRGSLGLVSFNNTCLSCFVLAPSSRSWAHGLHRGDVGQVPSSPARVAASARPPEPG